MTKNKPERPYRNLQEFRQSIVKYGTKASSLDWPCLTCNGKGWAYDPNDPPCPVEGNKMRDRISCKICGGSGIGTRKLCMEAYKKIIENWKESLSKWEFLKDAWDKLVLTDTQKEAIRVFGL